MTTRLHQTWDLGDGVLTLDLSHVSPLPSAAYSVLSALASNIETHADALRMLLKRQPGVPATPDKDGAT